MCGEQPWPTSTSAAATVTHHTYLHTGHWALANTLGTGLLLDTGHHCLNLGLIMSEKATLDPSIGELLLFPKA